LPVQVGRLRFEDYREVDGLKVPFRMTYDERTWNVKSFRMNVTIPPKVFRPSGL